MLVKFDERELLAKAIADPDPAKAAKVRRRAGAAGRCEDQRPADAAGHRCRKSRWRFARRPCGAVGRNAPGQKWLLATVEQKASWPTICKFAAANVLLSSADDAIRTAAGKHLSLPAAAGGEPLPPIAELVKRTRRRGPRQGAVRRHDGTCAKCHKVKGEGKEVGPDLSEIGTQALARRRMYVSILDPSAGVSFNYETWLVRTIDGTMLTGILVSQTDDAVELKTAEAIVHKLRRTTSTR